MSADTIAAIASPPGPARRGIVRLSGPESARLVRATFRPAAGSFDAARPRALLAGRLDDGRGGQPALLLWMRAPRSFTREDVAELHLRGAEPLLAAALARLLALGARAARPGEFTRRAFLNGRIDLSRAEGVLALTEAASEAERRAATRLLEGGLATRAGALRGRLEELAMLCEASLDFDEGETGHVPAAELAAGLAAAGAALDEARALAQRPAAPTALPRVVLLGAPNAGKSSLWNALTGGRALVSAAAGTTRDALEAPWAAGGARVTLVDGPGREEGAEGPGRAAQELFARERAAAELGLWVVDAVAGVREPVPDGARILAWNKTDDARARPAPAAQAFTPPLAVVPVSARSGAGLAELGAAVASALAGPGEGEALRTLGARHAEALARVAAELERVGRHLAAAAPLDLVAEDVRQALAALDELTGRTTPEDVLDRIFARFCLGK
ncbi:MAG TPA: GTPase [Planctomycetota bacterium]